MNNNEIWHRWEPVKSGLTGNYYIDYVENGDDGFKILLAQEKTEQKVEVLFKHWVYAYRSIEEGMRTVLWHKLSEKYGKDFYVNWSFFKLENSSYIKWISDECYGRIDSLEMNHFVIMGMEEVIDIIVGYEPQVSILPTTEAKLGAETIGE